MRLRPGDAPAGPLRSRRIDDLAGLAATQPLLAAALAIFMFSLAGIPPFAGFFGKLYVFMAAVEAGLTPLAVLGVLASVVGAYYYLRIVKLMYFDEPAESFDRTGRLELQAVVTVVRRSRPRLHPHPGAAARHRPGRRRSPDALTPLPMARWAQRR